MKSKKLLLLAIAVAVMSAAATHLAAQAPIGILGTYSYTGQTSCLYSSTGFNPNLTPIVVNNQQPSVWVSTFQTQGLLTFNLNGTGVVISSELANALFPANLAHSNADSDDVTFTFSYQVVLTGKIRTFTLQVQSLQGTILTGPNAADTFTIANLPPLSGPMAFNGTMVLAGAAPAVETITLTDPTGKSSSTQRVCQRMRTLTRLY